MRTSLALLVAVGALIASACSPAGDDNANGGLANTAWTVVAIGGAPTIPDAQPTMAFSPEGVVSGTSGCNAYSGPYRTDGDQIAVGDLASTLIGCDGQLGAQEGAFTTGLSGATTWRQTADGNLELSGLTAIIAEPDGPDGPPETIAPADLPGTSWVLVEMGGSADFGGVLPTLEFGGDGTVGGFAGCNTFQSTYTVGGAALSLGGLTTTDIGCEPPASTVEADYLEALSGVTGWAVVDGTLRLDGPVPMTLGPR